LRIRVTRDGSDEKNLESSSIGLIFVYHAYKKVNANVPLNIKKFKTKIDFGGFGIETLLISLTSF
jgi:hypothetical protein